MKKIAIAVLFGLWIVVGLAVAQGNTPITVGASRGNCQASGTILNCYTVPMTIGNNTGTAWVYPQGNGGFIIFRSPLEGGVNVEATVNTSTVTGKDAVGRTTQLVVTYTVNGDSDGDGDTDTVVGTITFNIIYTRGYHNLLYPSVSDGSGAQSITVD
jgi:hypothetical protein